MAPEFTDEQVLVFKAARAFADRVYALLAEEGGSTDSRAARSCWLEERRGESVNPFYSQTASGLCLEMYYGLPNKVWTPWGAWGFGGSGSGDFASITKRLLAECDAEMVQERTTNFMGVYGPVYCLKRVGDIALPAAVARPRTDFISYEDAKAQWEALVARYGVGLGAPAAKL
jgi:hypothetical protein